MPANPTIPIGSEIQWLELAINDKTQTKKALDMTSKA